MTQCWSDRCVWIASKFQHQINDFWANHIKNKIFSEIELSSSSSSSSFTQMLHLHKPMNLFLSSFISFHFFAFVVFFFYVFKLSCLCVSFSRFFLHQIEIDVTGAYTLPMQLFTFLSKSLLHSMCFFFVFVSGEIFFCYCVYACPTLSSR